MMKMKNQRTQWGLVAVSFHWLSAFLIVGLFALGFWMTDLDYYDSWYKQGPFIHKSIGIIIAVVISLRLVWRLFDRDPQKLASHSDWEKRAATIAHAMLYVLLLIIVTSGYLISTADGRAISVFDIIQIPASIIQGIDQQEELAGTVHWYAACFVIGLAFIHSLGAFKHHVIDKDETLRRMIGKNPK